MADQEFMVAIGPDSQAGGSHSVVIGESAGSATTPANTLIIGDYVTGQPGQPGVVQVSDRMFIGPVLFGVPNPIYEFVRSHVCGAFFDV